MGETKQTIKWEGTGTPLPSGHKIIETHDNGNGEHGWAIWDPTFSERPEGATVDGVAWLDPTRCLNGSTRHRPTIPVESSNGEKFSIAVDTPTILYLSRFLKWTIEDEVRGHFYNVS